MVPTIKLRVPRTRQQGTNGEDSNLRRLRGDATGLKRILEDAGHDVIEGGDETVAAYLFREHQPDCALLDINMPIMDGIEAVTKIMLIDHAAKIAMVTGERNETTVFQAMSAGAMDYVSKPYKSDRVLDTVDKMLAKARAA